MRDDDREDGVTSRSTCNPPAARGQLVGEAFGRLGEHGDLGEADLRAGRVLETEVFEVHADLADLGEQAGELARAGRRP